MVAALGMVAIGMVVAISLLSIKFYVFVKSRIVRDMDLSRHLKEFVRARLTLLGISRPKI